MMTEVENITEVEILESENTQNEPLIRMNLTVVSDDKNNFKNY